MLKNVAIVSLTIDRMPTTVLGEEIRTLGSTLQSLLGDTSLGIQCTLKNGRLIVLGQHAAETALDPSQTLRSLERSIQSLQIRCTQQAQVYLRIAGEKQPYAGRRFVIQPPPPPPNPALCQPPAEARGGSATTQDAKWSVPDDELEVLVNELVPNRSEGSGLVPVQPTELTAPTTSETDAVSIVPYVAARDPVEGESASGLKVDRRTVLATGILFGVAGGVYALTRPCMVGACPELQQAQALNQESLATVKQAKTAEDLKLAQRDLAQAVALLDRIPVWSPQGQRVRPLLDTYEEQAIALDRLVELETMAADAAQRSQNPPHPVDEWQAIVDLWQSMIQQLKAIAPDSPLYAQAQQRLPTYETHLRDAQTQLKAEAEAHERLALAQQTAQLAETRQKMAQSLANWQLTRATWQVAMLRLNEVPEKTQAAVEAQQALKVYQTRLNAATAQLQQEQATDQVLAQAAAQAQNAQAAEQQYNWQQAVTEWEAAIALLGTVPKGTTQQARVSSLNGAYSAYRDRAKQKLDATHRVETELSQTCTGALQICHLLVVDQAIQVQLDPRYVSAIEVARNTGDGNLQAVVADHQLKLRRALEGIAQRFQLPVEVFDPGNILLDRHMPTRNSTPGTN